MNSAALVSLAGTGLSVGLSSCKKGGEGVTQPSAGNAGESSTRCRQLILTGRLKFRPGNSTTITCLTVVAISAKHASTVFLPAGLLNGYPFSTGIAKAVGGITNEPRAIIGTKADGSLRSTTGDTHHVHGSYTEGTYVRLEPVFEEAATIAPGGFFHDFTMTL